MHQLRLSFAFLLARTLACKAHIQVHVFDEVTCATGSQTSVPSDLLSMTTTLNLSRISQLSSTLITKDPVLTILLAQTLL